ncbi:SGNH/GDSL hydrolase family protein, partial [Pseudomonas aeruginosa]|nr:SGNH/GDSL hydrolase family protein [Pseudomonas aeruginosa]
MKRPIERLPAATSSATRAFALATSLLYACAAPAASWTASWQASPQPVWAEDFLFPSNVPAELHDQTVRQLARISLGGTRVRIVLANTYGKRPIRIGRATLAKPGSERAAVATGSLHDVTFGGRRTATI